MKIDALYRLCFLLIVALDLSACGGFARDPVPEDASVIRIFAAAGSRLVTQEICKSFEDSTGVEIAYNYASSGILARQISSGANAHIFISANREWMSYLVEKELMAEDMILTLARNSLVVVAPSGQETAFPELHPGKTPDLPSRSRIALGDPSYVPVGAYARQVFDRMQWSECIYAQAILGKDVSAVLNYATTGACDWAVVYKTEALLSEKVEIQQEIPDSLHSPILFYLAVMDKGSGPEAAHVQALASHFQGPTGRKLFVKHGFSLPGR